MLLRLLRPTLKTATTLQNKTNLSTTASDGFKIIYKFPFVNHLGLINRLKVYQTVLTATTVPTSVIINQMGFCESDVVLSAAVIGFAGIFPLYSFGYFVNKLIGIVYFNEKDNLVKVAYLDFWGRRNDSVVPVNDIVPFNELPRSWTDPVYFKFKQYMKKEDLKICLKYGVLDSVSFNKVFSSQS